MTYHLISSSLIILHYHPRCAVNEYERAKQATSHRSHRSLEESPRHFSSFSQPPPYAGCNIMPSANSRRHQPHGRSKVLQGSDKAYDLRLLPESTCIEGLQQGYKLCPEALVQGPGEKTPYTFRTGRLSVVSIPGNISHTLFHERTAQSSYLIGQLH